MIAALENARRLRRDPVGLFRELASGGEPVRDVRVGPVRVTVVSHPGPAWDLLSRHADDTEKGPALRRARLVLGEGLLTSEGDVHEARRRALRPAFGRPGVSARGDVLVDGVRAASATWWDGQVLVLDDVLGALALAGASAFLVGTDLGDDATRLRADLAEVVRPGVGTLPAFPGRFGRRRRRAAARLHATVEGVVRAHRPSTGRPDTVDLLQRAGIGDPRALRDEVTTLLLAGHETTALLLTWAFAAVAGDARVRTELERELDATLAGPDGTHRAATPQDALPYTTAVLAEALRLWPPAWAIGRRAVRAFELDGHRVPAGRLVVTSPAALHRDGRWWPEPDRFRPERWLAADADGPRFERSGGGRPHGAFLPFGVGPRRCVGENLAWVQATVVLATVASRWRIELLGPPPRPGAPTITLRPDAPVTVRLHDRYAGRQPAQTSGEGALGRSRRLSAGSAMDARNGLAG